MKLKYRIVRTLLKSLSSGNTVEVACKSASLSPWTYYYWVNKHPRFQKLAERCKDSRIEAVEDALFKSAIKGSTNAQRYFLNNRRAHKWKDDPIIVNVEQKLSIFQQIHNNYSTNGHKIEESDDNGHRKVRNDVGDRITVIE